MKTEFRLITKKDLNESKRLRNRETMRNTKLDDGKGLYTAPDFAYVTTPSYAETKHTQEIASDRLEKRGETCWHCGVGVTPQDGKKTFFCTATCKRNHTLTTDEMCVLRTTYPRQYVEMLNKRSV